jgi:ADP-dependent NAD(P)H-hydrate dehydratase / NAD(P)H-hydrate epimerase
MKILTSSQIRAADQYTIHHEPISSIDLMERASVAFISKFKSLFPKKSPVSIFCGIGNNGGDGLAVGRLLQENGWNISFYIIGDMAKGSPDFLTNLGRIDSYSIINSPNDFPKLNENVIVIDALFGSGLSRPLDGLIGELVDFLNDQKTHRIAIDIASGLYADKPIINNSIIFKPHFTLSFQSPKLTFFLPEYYQFVGEWLVLDIGLDPTFMRDQASEYFLTETKEIKDLIPSRSKFTHKNEVGSLQIIAGSKGKMGAAVLCAKAAFRAGVGLVNVQVPKCGTNILQTTIPEAMVVEDVNENVISEIQMTNDTVAIGPGLGTDGKTMKAFSQFLDGYEKPLVVDADAINLLASDQSLLKKIPENSILTPHIGEFKRLVGDWNNDFEKLEKLKSFCQQHRLNVVLKGAYSAVCNMEGVVHFNPSGNPTLATAGSGDVLTGIVGSLLAQGLSPFDALRLGVYVHGLAGDLAQKKIGALGVIASDIILEIPSAIDQLLNS